MVDLFRAIIPMSIAGSLAILAICLARIPLKSAPRRISYALWAVVALRLILPFAPQSPWGLMPNGSLPIPQNPPFSAGNYIYEQDFVFMPIFLPNPESPPVYLPQTSDLLPALYSPQILPLLATSVWLIVALGMLIFAIFSYINLRRKMAMARQIRDNIYEADPIKTPFVLGLFAPRIYIPTDLTPQERDYIILHEQIHIRRRDHLIKFAAYLILCLHWFNSLVWLAFRLMSADMEYSCDEKVLAKMENNVKIDYARSLVNMATRKPIWGAAHLPFGQNYIKKRVINVLNYKQKSKKLTALAVALAILLGFGLMLDRTHASPITIENSGESRRIFPEQTLVPGGFAVVIDHVPPLHAQTFGPMAILNNSFFQVTITVGSGVGTVSAQNNERININANRSTVIHMPTGLQTLTFHGGFYGLTDVRVEIIRRSGSIGGSIDTLFFGQSERINPITFPLSRHDATAIAFYYANLPPATPVRITTGYLRPTDTNPHHQWTIRIHTHPSTIPIHHPDFDRLSHSFRSAGITNIIAIDAQTGETISHLQKE